MPAATASCSRHSACESPLTTGRYAVWDYDTMRHRGNQVGEVFFLEEWSTLRIAQLMAEWYDENPESKITKV